MRLIIQPDAELVAKWTARYICRRINHNRHGEGEKFVLGLPTGSTPIPTYNELIRLYREGKVSFANVVTFNMDEYVGLPEDHPQSYHSYMWNNFFSHIDIKPENVNILDGNAADLEAECRRYEEKIAQAGGIDLFIGGVGEDGHIAFNEPFSSMTSKTRIKTLTTDTIIANSRFFDGDPTKVPSQSLTVGVGTVLDAYEVLIIATGYNKARAMRHIVEEGYNHRWTASALQTHSRGILVCDELAATELKLGTVKYFCEIERNKLDPESIII